MYGGIAGRFQVRQEVQVAVAVEVAPGRVGPTLSTRRSELVCHPLELEMAVSANVRLVVVGMRPYWARQTVAPSRPGFFLATYCTPSRPVITILHSSVLDGQEAGVAGTLESNQTTGTYPGVVGLITACLEVISGASTGKPTLARKGESDCRRGRSVPSSLDSSSGEVSIPSSARCRRNSKRRRFCSYGR